MSDDDFFDSPRQKEKITNNAKIEDKQKSILDEDIEDKEIMENGRRKDIKIIEAKIPSVTALTDSIMSDQSNESDYSSDTDKYSPNLNVNDNNQLKIKNLPNKMHTQESKQIFESECSDVDNASPMHTPQSKKISKNSGAKKSTSSISIQNKSVHNKEQAHELKQFLGSLFDKNTQANSINSNTIRNYSFSNDKLKAIDKENQRLLEKITLYASESKKSRQSINQKSKITLKSTTNNHSRPSSAAVNRRMQQRKIDDENMAMLRRLQQVRPSKELQALNASRPSSSLSTRSTSMTNLRSGTAKRKSMHKSEDEFTFRGDHMEPTTALQFT